MFNLEEVCVYRQTLYQVPSTSVSECLMCSHCCLLAGRKLWLSNSFNQKIFISSYENMCIFYMERLTLIKAKATCWKSLLQTLRADLQWQQVCNDSLHCSWCKWNTCTSICTHGAVGVKCTVEDYMTFTLSSLLTADVLLWWMWSMQMCDTEQNCC